MKLPPAEIHPIVGSDVRSLIKTVSIVDERVVEEYYLKTGGLSYDLDMSIC